MAILAADIHRSSLSKFAGISIWPDLVLARSSFQGEYLADEHFFEKLIKKKSSKKLDFEKCGGNGSHFFLF